MLLVRLMLSCEDVEEPVMRVDAVLKMRCAQGEMTARSGVPPKPVPHLVAES